MFEQYLIPVLIVVGIGLAAGIILVLAAKYMAVTVDEKYELVRNLLPGVNCGACGYKGCDDYANHLVSGEAAVNLCIPGGEGLMQKISNTLGKASATVVPRTAAVACSATYELVDEKMEYRSRSTCAAAALFYHGLLACDHGCLGLGDCMRICTYDAISIVDGLAVVDKRRCSGCGKCSTVCPQGVIHIIPHGGHIFVGCSSTDSGAQTRKNCRIGCLGCGKCSRVCPEGAIKLENALAVIDQERCTGCGTCLASCPVKVIHTCYQTVGEARIRRELAYPQVKG